MGWVGDALGWCSAKGRFIVDVVHIAMNRDAIERERRAFRDQIADREAWARRMQEQLEELHRIERERLGAQHARERDELVRQVDEWRAGTARGLDLVGRFEALLREAIRQLDETQAAREAAIRDLIDALVLLARLLAWEPPAVQQAFLATLRPGARAIVERAIQQLAPPRPGLADLLAARQTLSQILGPPAPPPLPLPPAEGQ